MGLLSGLRALFGRKLAPPQIAGGFGPAGMDRPDEAEIIITITETRVPLGDLKMPTDAAAECGPEPETSPERVADTGRRYGRLRDFRTGLTRIDDDLRGITFAIEYEDSKGNGSTRRITLHDLYRDGRGHTFVQGICHERAALRCFRFDRIQAVIDMDGEVHEPVMFFRDELRVAIEVPQPAAQPDPSPPPQWTPAPARRSSDGPGMAQRRVARDGLRLLAGLARADGILHSDEIVVILDYIAAVADREGIATTEDDRAALFGYVKRQRPTSEILEDCLDRMEYAGAEDQRLFIESAMALTDADGYQDPAEFEMLMELRDRLGGAA